MSFGKFTKFKYEIFVYYKTIIKTVKSNNKEKTIKKKKNNKKNDNQQKFLSLLYEV